MLICGGLLAGFYFWAGLHQTNQAAQLVPAERAVAYAAVSPTVWQAPALLRGQNLEAAALVLAPLAATPGVLELLPAVQALPLQELEVDPVRHVLPWVGREVGVVVLQEGAGVAQEGIMAPGGRGKRQAAHGYDGPPILVAAAVRDEGQARTFMSDLRRQLEGQGIAFVDSSHRGVLIGELDTEDQVPFAYAIFDDMLLVSTSVEPLREAITFGLDGNASQALGRSEAFERLVRSLPANRLGFSFVDVSALTQNVAGALRELGVEAVDQAAASVTLAGNQVRLDYFLHYDTRALSRDQEQWLRRPASASTLAATAPEDSLMYFSSHQLQTHLEGLDADGWRDTARELQWETGIDIEDTLEGLSGEFALIVMRDGMGLLGDRNIPVNVMLMLDVADDEAALQDLDALGQWMAFEEGMQINRERFGAATMWFLEDGRLGVGYGVSGNSIVIGTSRAILEDAVAAADEPLAQNELFVQATEALPEENWGTLYVNVEELVDLLQDDLDPRSFDNLVAATGPFIWELRAVAIAAEPLDEDDYLHAAMSIVLQDD